MNRTYLLLFVLLLPLLQVCLYAQKHKDKYPDYPKYMDSVAILPPYVKIIIRTGDSDMYDKYEDTASGVEARKMYLDLLQNVSKKRVMGFYYQQDSLISGASYYNEVEEMILFFGDRDSYWLKDTSFLYKYRFSKELCSELKKSGSNYCMSTHLVYYSNSPPYQHQLHPNGVSTFLRLKGSEGIRVFFVINLNTGYPIFYTYDYDDWVANTLPDKIFINLEEPYIKMFLHRIKKE